MRAHEFLAEDAVSRFSPAFWAWFRNSQVVDQHGRPLRVYHSTFADFESFYSGSHFGDIEAANARWTNYRKDGELPRFGVSHGGAILPVYLSIQNPLRIQDDKGLTDGNDLALAARYAGVMTKAEYEQITATGSPGIAKRRLFKFLETQGYDGLVYQNAVEGRGDSWVPFWPNQIKSAIANQGTWDPGSESITESATPARPLSEEEFNALVVANFKQQAMEANGWKTPLTIYHGTTADEAKKIRNLGYFQASETYPSFFTTRRSEAADYAKVRATQQRGRGRSAEPFVFALRVQPWAVTLNHGSDEVETHPLIPLHVEGNTGTIRDADIVAAEARWDPANPHRSFAAYLRAAEAGDPEALAIGGDLDGDLEVPVARYDGTVVGTARIRDLSYHDLLATYHYLKRKRQPQYVTMRDKVYAWGMKLQRERGV